MFIIFSKFLLFPNQIRLICDNISKVITKLVVFSTNGIHPEIKLWSKNNF